MSKKNNIHSAVKIVSKISAAGIDLLSGLPIASTIISISEEFTNRQLSSWEVQRINSVLDTAAKKIDQRIKNGENIRTDGFFDVEQGGRSDAKEIAEAVVVKAQKEVEKKKIEYMGYLLANISFDPQISVHLAHQIIKAADELTYQQLCILSILGRLLVEDRKNEFYEGVICDDFKAEVWHHKELYQIIYACHDLRQRGYVYFASIIGPEQFKPSEMRLHGMAMDIYNLISLGRIPSSDIVRIIHRLENPVGE